MEDEEGAEKNTGSRRKFKNLSEKTSRHRKYCKRWVMIRRTDFIIENTARGG